MNIRVDLNTPINEDGTEVVFRSPVDCSQVTGLKVYYDGVSQEFAFADAHGNNVGDIPHLFAENVVVKVILDVTTGMAFVQNADTNAYLEGRFDALDEGIASCVIVEKAEGETISLTDSSNNPLRGLALYGKTTQNGTPTPTAPIALESAGNNGGVTIYVGDGTEGDGQTLTVTTTNGLPGVPVASGGNYTDQSGQQWVCDEIDLNRGVYVKRIQQETYNGTEAWFYVGSESDNYSNYRPLLNLAVLAKDSTYPVICSHFKYEPLVRINSGNNIGCYANDGTLGIRHGIANMTTIAQWKEWLAQNNITVQYVLATPVETPLEDVPDYTELHTNKPNTVITADGAVVGVTYVADTKAYIDNKFTELQNAILAAGANV